MSYIYLVIIYVSELMPNFWNPSVLPHGINPVTTMVVMPFSTVLLRMHIRDDAMLRRMSLLIFR